MSWVDLLDAAEVRSVHRWPPRDGTSVDWPDWVSVEVRAAVGRLGVERPWSHQTEAASAAYAGRHVMVATPTSSGKSLAYLLPVLAATADPTCRAAPETWDTALRPRRPATALYLAPTKALAHDQLRLCTSLGLPSWRVTTLDGDSAPAARDWARDEAAYVLSNPDMLHFSLLPQHARWASFLGALRYVVVDEAHRYTGVFGAHVAQVLRRLRRLCAAYGSTPVFVLASATTANPAAAAAGLIGVSEREVTVVDSDRAPQAARTLVLWEPAGSAEEGAATLLARLVASGHQTVAFTSARRSAEVVALQAQRAVASSATAWRIEAYRGGYLAADRRRLEQELQQRTLHGVAATNALELGVDIAGLDAVVIAGFPGTRAAFWQQAGRAGRGRTEALVVLVSRKQPLDAYLFDHPEVLVGQPVEATVLHPDNPYVLGPHLAAAAQERPLTEADLAFFGPAMPGLLAQLERQQVLRWRTRGWFWTRPERAVDAINLRTSGPSVEIVEPATGRVLGDVDPVAADATVHPGAVYLHQGETYLCERLDAEAGEALVRPATPGYLTQARRTGEVRIIREQLSRRLGGGRLAYGEVEVTRRVTGYLRRDAVTGTVWDETALDLPSRTLRTTGCWWTLDPSLVEESWTRARLRSGAHAAAHIATLLLPVYSPCDRWDVAGVSALDHPDTGVLTVFVHDAQPGGAGFSERGYAVADAWLAAASQRLEQCACLAGCPACVVSPTCGSGNQGLDKAAAQVLLGHLGSRADRCALGR
jgi:DEAD/DEAH box helicase domain-containing protein